MVLVCQGSQCLSLSCVGSRSCSWVHYIPNVTGGFHVASFLPPSLPPFLFFSLPPSLSSFLPSFLGIPNDSLSCMGSRSHSLFQWVLKCHTLLSEFWTKIPTISRLSRSPFVVGVFYFHSHLPRGHCPIHLFLELSR